MIFIILVSETRFVSYDLNDSVSLAFTVLLVIFRRFVLEILLIEHTVKKPVGCRSLEAILGVLFFRVPELTVCLVRVSLNLEFRLVVLFLTLDLDLVLLFESFIVYEESFEELILFFYFFFFFTALTSLVYSPEEKDEKDDDGWRVVCHVEGVGGKQRLSN